MGSDATKRDLLIGMLEQQQITGRYLLSSDAHKNAGRLDEARSDYDTLIAALRRHLELAETNNRLFPETPVTIGPLVGPLASAPLIQSDVEARGEPCEADRLRDEAVAVTEKYLTGADVAERKSQQGGGGVWSCRTCTSESKRIADPVKAG